MTVSFSQEELERHREAIRNRFMRHRVYHGCGHFWIRARLRFDAYDETVEGWYYSP